MDMPLLIIGLGVVGATALYVTQRQTSDAALVTLPASDYPSIINSISQSFTALPFALGVTSTPDLGITLQQSDIATRALATAQVKLKQREGYSRNVYRDSKGILTVGIGHKVVASDGLSLGDVISDNRVTALFAQDSKKSLEAAMQQTNVLGVTDIGFIAALISVNFQLGAGWTSVHPKTWAYLKTGDGQNAIREIYSSLWYEETPERVADFATAIQTSFV